MGWRAIGWLLLGGTGLLAAAGGWTLWRLSHPETARAVLPERLISNESDTGRALLSRADAKADYPLLARWFVSQEKLNWSGVASGTIVLNALFPPARGESLTQRGFFDEPARRVRGPLHTTLRGLSLDALSQMLAAHGARSETVYSTQISQLKFRTLAGANLGNPDDFLIVSYDRKRLGQAGGGHLSPVAAWDREADRYLVLDTAAYRYPWTWVSGADLWAGMDTEDPDSGQMRGLIVVARQP